MEKKLIINGELMSLNAYIDDCRGNRFAGAEMKRAMDNYVSQFIRGQLRDVRFEKEVHIDFLWVCGNRKKDPDNVCFAKKFILDALVRCGVIPNDSWKYIHGFTDSFEVDSKNPRIEVVIREV